MAGPVDQRRTQRFICKSPIVFSSLDDRKVYSARTVNHCDSGLCFVTQAPFETGLTIFFRADSHTQKRLAMESCRTMRGAGLAQIRWCRRLIGPKRVRFRVGAEYMEPYP